ncbi:P-loop containing nucleoside triphosphate hydrolase protein, partial [Gigaspora rosea]
LLLTATCSQTNVQMIKDNLGLLDLNVFRSSTISRPEIQLEVLNKPAQKENQTKLLLDLVQLNFPNRCIVYFATIDDCDTYYNVLAKHFGLNIVGKYHGSMPSKNQNINLENWKNGQLKLISATTAFGIGLNVNDVRAVIHTTFPISIDELVQETGRAGRNGMAAKNVIMYSSSDIRTLLLIIS